MKDIAVVVMLGLLLAGVLYVLYFLFRVLRGERVKVEEPPTKEEAEKASKASTSLIGFLFAAGAFWYFFYFEPAPTYNVTSINLYKEFDKDKVKAFAKYQDQFVAVTGKYVGNDVVFGSPAILLQAPAVFERVQCNFESGRADQAASLTLGKVVTLKGRVLGKTSNVVLEKCSVYN